MKPITVTLLLLILVVCGCVDADEGRPSNYSIESKSGSQNNGPTQAANASPETNRTVSYVSEEPWDGWEASPERVKVTVRSDERRHTHYFESLPVAYGWLPERYDDFEIVDLLIANALSGRDLLNYKDAHFLLSRGQGDYFPEVLAYPSRREAAVVVDRYPDRYALADWVELDRDMDGWRSSHWDDWRDDFGFIRSASVAHLDGAFWDGWYDTPDRVLVRMSSDGAPSSYYFDSLPVAWSWLDSRPAGFELIDLQVAAADGSPRLLPAREATYLWLPSGSDTLPAALAFGTRAAADNYLRALGDTGFRLADWDDLKPRLTSWSDEHWNAWRGNPEHKRGIARALESGLGHKLGLRLREEGAVAGEHRKRERVSSQEKKAHKEEAKLKDKGKGKDKPAGKSKVGKKDQGSSKGKAKAKQDRKHGNKSVKGKAGQNGSKAKSKSGSGKHKAKAKRGGSKKHDEERRGKSGGGGHGKDKGGGKK